MGTGRRFLIHAPFATTTEFAVKVLPSSSLIPLHFPPGHVMSMLILMSIIYIYILQ